MAKRNEARQCNIPIPKELAGIYDKNTQSLGCTKTSAAAGMIRVWTSLPDDLQRQMLGSPGPDAPYKRITAYIEEHEINEKLEALTDEQRAMFRTAVGNFYENLIAQQKTGSSKLRSLPTCSVISA